MTTALGSRQSNSFLDFFREPQSYLKARMELGSFESTQKETGRQQAISKVKITVSNTANPEEPSWPKIVFVGVGLSVAYLGGGISNIAPHELTSREGKAEEAPKLEGPPWQQDGKFKSLLEIKYNRIVGQDFPDTTSDLRTGGKVLFPGQSVTFEVDVPPQVVPYLQFRVDGTVSRRHLLHYEETLPMPETLTKPLALTALRALNAIGIHRALDSVIASMPEFSGDTRLADVQAFSAALTTGMAEIKATQEAVSNLFRQHEMFWFQAHLRAAYVYLDRVTLALARMREAIASSIPGGIAAAASTIRASKEEAAQFNRTTVELMHRHNISDEELKHG